MEEIEKETQAEDPTDELLKDLSWPDYIKYERVMEFKTRDIHQTTEFKGKQVNLMTLEYNLKQLEYPEHKRVFRTKQEVIAHFLATGVSR